jgi:hypothetical protein
MVLFHPPPSSGIFSAAVIERKQLPPTVLTTVSDSLRLFYPIKDQIICAISAL